MLSYLYWNYNISSPRLVFVCRLLRHSRKHVFRIRSLVNETRDEINTEADIVLYHFECTVEP